MSYLSFDLRSATCFVTWVTRDAKGISTIDLILHSCSASSTNQCMDSKSIAQKYKINFPTRSIQGCVYRALIACLKRLMAFLGLTPQITEGKKQSAAALLDPSELALLAAT